MTGSEAAASPRTTIETDALVIGAGPVGLFQVFELGLLGIRAEVIDALPFVGGQCVELYAEKPIYDIPGTPVCTGRELIERLQAQIAPFRAGFHLDELVDSLVHRDSDDRFEIRGSRGTRIVARAVVLASGTGAFQPRRLKLEGIDRFEGGQLRYRRPADLADWPTDGSTLVIGDEDEALETAIALADHGAAVALLHRRDDFRASPATVATFRALREAGRIGFVAGVPQSIECADDTAVEGGGSRLAALQVLTPDGTTRRVPVDHLLVLTGLSPKLGPIADWGLALDRKQLVVDPSTFETSVPGVHAVGDAITYRGKKRLILCGFHEATLAAYAVAERVFPGRPNPLEYTTTSPRLHQALGKDLPPQP